MAKIDIDAVAELSKLHIPEGERERLLKDMENMVEFADSLNLLDAEGVPPAEHIDVRRNRFRDGVARTEFTREELLRGAPAVSDGYLSVPKAIEE